MSTPALNKGPLRDVRVLDLSAGFAGPFAATMLGDFGADIVKVERPGGGDFAREYGPTNQVWWKTLGRNKKSVGIDLKAPAALGVMERLVKASRVLVESFRPGVLERLEMAPDQLHAWNPDLIVLRVSGYGQHGPYSRKPGFGRAAEAFSGLLYLTGFPDGPPTHPGFAMADMTTGLMGAYAVLLALHAQDQGFARGQVIDLALYETTMRLMDYPVPLRTGSEQEMHRVGNRQPMAYAMSNVYRTRDGRWITYSAASLSVAKRVLRLIGGEEYAADPRFETLRSICRHEDEIDARLAAWIAERTADDVLESFSRVEAVAALIYSPDDLIADPHIVARESIVGFPGEQAKFVNVVPRLDVTPGAVRWLGPLSVGEDTVDVLRDVAGYDPETIGDLIGEGAVFQGERS